MTPRQAAGRSTRADKGETRSKLIDGAIETLRIHGLTGLSARTIAKVANVNQALIFYHFDSVYDLVGQACLEHTQRRVALQKTQFENVESLRDLLTAARSVHAAEKLAGNVQVLAQVLAGAQQSEELAETARSALDLWVSELRVVLRRVVDRSVLDGLVDTDSLAEMLAASFIGIELYDGIKAGSEKRDPFAALEPLALAGDLVDQLGAVPTKAIRARIRRVLKKAESSQSQQAQQSHQKEKSDAAN